MRYYELLSTVKREDFVPLVHKSLAFADIAIPLPGGPFNAIASRSGTLGSGCGHVNPTDKVLEIGTGSGFTTALLAHQAQRVISLEINPELANMARIICNGPTFTMPKYVRLTV